MADLQIRAILKDEFSAAAQKLIRELGQIGAQGSAAGAAMRSGMSSALPTVEAVNESLGRNVAQLRAQAVAYKSPEGARYLSEQKRLREEIDSLTKSGEQQGMTWANIASKYYLVAQAASFAAGVTGSLVEAASKYEMIRARLNAAEKSDALGGKDFETIQELAKKPGLGFEQAASTFATLRGMKVTAAETTKLISGIAAANASAAGTAEQFGGVMYQIQQSVSLGRLMAEDLRPIMQQIPTLGAAIQESFGTSQAEQLNERLKTSGMNVRDFWLKVAELGQNLPATGETISNNLDNMGDAWVRLRAALTDTEAIKNATGALASFIETAAKSIEFHSQEVELRKKAEKSLGIRTTKTNALTDAGFAEGAADEAKIRAEMIRLRQEEAWAAMNEEYEKAEQEDQERWDKQVKKDLDAWEQKQKEKRDKFQKQWDEDRAQERADALNKDEQDRANRNQILRMKLGRAGGEDVAEVHEVSGKAYAGYADVGIRSESYMKTDKKDYDDWSKLQDDRRKKLKEVSEDIIKQEHVVARAKDKIRKAERKKWEEDNKIASAIGQRFAEGSVSSLMYAFAPLDSVFDRMQRRNQEMQDSWTKTFEGVGLAFTMMLAKMAEEMAARAAMFGLLSMIPGFGGAGGFLGGASSFIFGARATGGVTLPGVRYRVNEDGYNGGGGEMFRSSSAGTISPNRGGGGGGGGNVQHFHFAAGTSRADRGAIVRAIKIATKSRENSVARSI